MKQVFIRRNKSTVYVDRHRGELRVSRVVPSWQFELLSWGISSGFPLANHFDLPGSQFIFGISQDPSVCARISQPRWILPHVGGISIGMTPPLTYKEPFCVHVV